MAEPLRDSGVRLLTLTGPGGVGKTRLAIAAAAEVEADYRDGLVYVPLAAVSDPNLVCVSIARLLGMRDMGETSALDRLVELFGDKHLLLVLDNFEHVIEASRGLARILGGAPGVKALVTSRVRLRLSGEREFPVAPLAVNGGDGDETPDAVRLFCERARAISPGFSPSSANPVTLQEIVRRVDGLPLAIELAAARVKALSPEALLLRMEHRLPLLTGGARDLPLRQQTMRDTIAWSYDLLSPTERRLFRRLSVFAGGFTLEAAEYVGGGGGEGGDDFALRGDAALGGSRGRGEGRGREAVLDGVAELVEQSLLILSPEAGTEPRYTMLETVREFGLERLTERGEAAEVGRQHALLYLQLGETAGPALYGAEQGLWLDRLEAEYANLQAALTWAASHAPAMALQLAEAILRFWPIRGHLSEGRSWLERALAAQGAGGDEDQAARAGGLTALAWVLYWQGDFARGVSLAEEARVLRQRLGDRHGEADALRVLGHCEIGVAWEQSPPDREGFARAGVALAEQLALWQALDVPSGIAAALHNLGFLALNEGDAERTRPLLTEAIGRFKTLGDRWSAALSRQFLAAIDADQGRGHEAAGELRQSLADFLNLGDRWKISYLLDAAAAIVVPGGEAAAGARLLAAAESLRAADGIRYFRVHAAGRERPIAAARRALGERGFAAAWAAGREMTLEAAVAEAMSGLQAIEDAPANGRTIGGVRLTRREREVLGYLARGLSDRDIAAALGLSPRTVGGHVTNLLGKLGVDSRTAAVAFAYRHGEDGDGDGGRDGNGNGRP